METLVPKKLYVIERLLNVSECEKLVALIDKREEVTEGKIEQPMENRFQEQYNDSDLAKWVWDRLRGHLGSLSEYVPYQCSPIIPIVRYNDNGLATVIHLDPKNDIHEIFGVIIYLNDNHEGCTSFYNYLRQELAKIQPKRGKAVIFHLPTMWHKGHQPKAKKYIVCPRIRCRVLAT